MADFTTEPWEDLSASARRKIAGHFAWAKALPPESYGDLKLPHHRASDGKIVWRGVTAAMGAVLGARGGVDIPEGERRAVYNHLARHYRQFEKDPPEFRAYRAEELGDFDETVDYQAAMDRESKQDGFELQTVIFPKSHWDSADACRTWLKDHDLKSSKLDETDDSYRFRQREPGDFERLRTICLTPADTPPGSENCRIKAVGGPLKAMEPDRRIMLEIEDIQTVEDFLDLTEEEWAITPEEVHDFLAAPIRYVLREVVSAEVLRAVNRLTGRVE